MPIELHIESELAFALWTLLGLLVVIGCAAFSPRIGVPAPLLLIVVGILASFSETVPDLDLNPEIVLLGILPPLLYSAAYRTSFIDFNNKRFSIASLSVGLVIATSLIVGVVATWLIPGLPLAAGIALGAIVAPPDAVAATAVARRIGMPTGIVQILEGESLVNDATSLTVLRSAIAALSVGTVVWGQVLWTFALASVGGILVGLAVAYLYLPIRNRIVTPAIDTTLSLAIPFVAYLPAEAIGSSGVIAVVVAGLLIGHQSPTVQSGKARLTADANWSTVTFVLENSVFLLIGLELPVLLQRLGQNPETIRVAVLASLGVYLTTVVVRFAWVFAANLIPPLARENPTDARERTVISWAGMRGVVTLAAALTLGSDVPEKDTLVFAAFGVVVASLLIQGFTLPGLVKRLRLAPPDPAKLALERANLIDEISQAGLRRLEELNDGAQDPAVLQRLRQRVDERSQGTWELVALQNAQETPIEAFVRLRQQMMVAERDEVLRARDSGRYTDEVVREVIERLDVEEAMMDLSHLSRSERDEDLVAPDELAGGCGHLAAATGLPVPPEPLTCAACRDAGTRWVHLRMCLDCGHVGCCDSSEGKHADGHFRSTGHPVMRSVTPGEAWRWCYIDKVIGNPQPGENLASESQEPDG